MANSHDEVEAIAPVLEVALRIAEDRTAGMERRAGRWLDHRWDMQQALAKYVSAGGRLP